MYVIDDSLPLYFGEHNRARPREYDLSERNTDRLIRRKKERRNSSHIGTPTKVIETEWVVPGDAIYIMESLYVMNRM